jgi:glycogen(starch) synthase
MQRLEKEIEGSTFITLLGGRQPVPHTQIMEAIAQADLGLIAYRPNRSTENCIPTKLYEYLASGLPYLLPPNPIWNAYTKRYEAGLEIDYQQPDAEKILTALRKKTFYTIPPGEEVYWESEEEKLQAIVKDLLSR